MRTLKQVMERIEALHRKRELIDAVKDWLDKSFNGSTSISGVIIPAEIVDELLIDIDGELLVQVDEELNSLESMEVQDGKGTKGSAKRTEPTKARSQRIRKARS